MVLTSTRTKKTQGGKLGKYADEAMSRFRLVTEGSDVDHVKYPDADDETVCGRPIGVLSDGCKAAEDAVDIDLLGRGETKFMKLNGTCAKDDWLTPEAPGTDATGQVRKLPTTAGAYFVVGRAMEAGTDGQEIAVDDCKARLVGPQDANGDLGLPGFDGDPASPIESALWYDYTNDKVRGKNGTSAFTVQVVEE